MADVQSEAKQGLESVLGQDTVQAAEEVRRLISTADAFREQALQILEATRDKRGEAREQHGLLAWALGKSADAVKTLDGSAESPRASYVLGLSLQDLSRHEEAATALRRAARSEKNVPARHALLHSRIALGEAEEVLKELKPLLKADDSAALHDLIGQCHESKGDWQQAIEAYQSALARDPNCSGAMFRLACQADLRGLDDEALELYERCSRLNPAPISAFMNLGVIYEDRGEYEKAASCYRIVLDADATHERARLYLKDAEASLHMYYDEEMEKVADARRLILAMPIAEFELSVRARNCLKKMNVETLADLVKLTEEELLGFRNFGETSLREVKKLLADKGLKLGMAPEALLQYRPPVVTAESLQQPIEDLHLSVRSFGCMEQLGVATVGDLCNRTKSDLMACRNFGRTSLKEIMDKLAELGLALADG